MQHAVFCHIILTSARAGRPKKQHRSNNNSHNSTINKRRTTPSAMAGCVPPFYIYTHSHIHIVTYVCVCVYLLALFQLTWNTAKQQRRKIKNKVPSHKNNANHSCCPLLLLLLSLLFVTVALQAITITTITSAPPCAPFALVPPAPIVQTVHNFFHLQH